MKSQSYSFFTNSRLIFYSVHIHVGDFFVRKKYMVRRHQSYHPVMGVNLTYCAHTNFLLVTSHINLKDDRHQEHHPPWIGCVVAQC